MICRHCKNPIDHFPMLIGALAYKHSNGFYACYVDSSHPMVPPFSQTYAEPEDADVGIETNSM